MIDLTWTQVALFGILFAVVGFIGWCFFKYALSTEIHLHYDGEKEEIEARQSDDSGQK